MDTVGEDAVPDAGAGVEEFADVPVELTDVLWVGYAGLEDVGLELQACVVDV